MIRDLLQRFISPLPRNPKLADLEAASQIIKKSIPALQPLVEREQMTAQNPMKFVGDMGTRALGGDPDAGILDNVDPGRTIRPPVLHPAQFLQDENTQASQPGGPVPVNPSLASGMAYPLGLPSLTQAQKDSFSSGKAPVEDPNQPLAPLTQDQRDAMMDGSKPLRPTSPRSTPEIERPKSQREQVKDEIRRRQGKTFNEKRGIMNSLKAAGIGFLQAFSQTDPRMSLTDRLLQAAGGGIAGGVGGTVDPNLAAKLWNKQKLAGLYGDYGQATGMEEADAKLLKAQQDAKKAGLDVEGAGIKNINDRVSDLLKVYTSDNKLDEMEAATLRTATGLPFTSQNWQKYVEKDEGGVPFIRPEFSDKYKVNPTLPINPAEVNKERTIEGQKFNVPDKTAFGVAGNVAVGNANRKEAASRFETTQETQAADREYKDAQEYETDARSHSNRVRDAKAKAAAAQKRLDVLGTQLTLAEQNKAAVAAQGYDTTEIDRQIGDIQSRKATAEGEIAAAGVLAAEPPPKKIIRPKNPRSGGKKSFSQSDIERVIRQ